MDRAFCGLALLAYAEALSSDVQQAMRRRACERPGFAMRLLCVRVPTLNSDRQPNTYVIFVGVASLRMTRSCSVLVVRARIEY